MKSVETREEQIQIIVESLQKAGYKGEVNQNTLPQRTGIFYHNDVAEMNTEKAVQIACMLITKMPTLDNAIGKVIEFMYEDGGFDIYDNVSNWSDVGEQILINDSQKNVEYVFGYINESYVDLVDKEELGKKIADSSIVDFENKMVIRIW